VLTKEDQTSLIWLRMNWESHYKISFEEGVWQALPLFAPTDILTAETAMELRDAMKDHFVANKAGRR